MICYPKTQPTHQGPPIRDGETGSPAPSYKWQCRPCPAPQKSIEIQSVRQLQVFLINICLTQKLLNADVDSSTEWTGGRQDHLLCLFWLTTSTSQRDISKLWFVCIFVFVLLSVKCLSNTFPKTTHRVPKYSIENSLLGTTNDPVWSQVKTPDL